MHLWSIEKFHFKNLKISNFAQLGVFSGLSPVMKGLHNHIDLKLHPDTYTVTELTSQDIYTWGGVDKGNSMKTEIDKDVVSVKKSEQQISTFSNFVWTYIVNNLNKSSNSYLMIPMVVQYCIGNVISLLISFNCSS